jgi:hypothetical protein
MRTGIGARLKGIAKVLPYLCAIELFLPGGTLIVLGYLLTRGPDVPATAEGERAVKAWRDFRELISANIGDGGSGRAEDNNSLLFMSRTRR